MMRLAERKLEMRGKKKGGSKWEKLREWEKKRNCPFDAKKVCPVTDGCSCITLFNLNPPKKDKLF